MTLAVLLVGIPTLIYLTLSLTGVQDSIKGEVEKELSALLDTRVSIGSLRLSLPDRVVLKEIAIADSTGSDALTVKSIDAGVDMKRLLLKKKITVTFAGIDGLKATIWRDAPGSPLNIARTIRALQPKDKNKPPTLFDLRIGHVVIVNSSASYDIKSAPAAKEGHFDANHIAIENFALNALIPRLSNNEYSVDLRRLTATERSGLKVDNIRMKAGLTDAGASIEGLVIEMPGTRLMPGNIGLSYKGWGDIVKSLTSIPQTVEILDGTYVTPSTFAAFSDKLAGIDDRIELSLRARGTADDFVVDNARIDIPTLETQIATSCRIKGLKDGIAKMTAEVSQLSVRTATNQLAARLNQLVAIPATVKSLASNAGRLIVDAKGGLENGRADVDADITTAQGSVSVDGVVDLPTGGRRIAASGHIESKGFDVGRLVDAAREVGPVAMNLDVDFKDAKPYPVGNVKGTFDKLTFKGYGYTGLHVDVYSDGGTVGGEIQLNDPNARIEAEGHLKTTGERPSTEFFVSARDINFAKLNLGNVFQGHRLSFDADASLEGTNPDNADGWLRITNLNYINDQGKGVALDMIDIEASNSTKPQRITIDSDVIEGSIEGAYRFATIGKTARSILAEFIPAIVGKEEEMTDATDDFSFNFTIKDNNNLERMVKLPVSIVYPVTINGLMSSALNEMRLDVDAPYLRQGKKMITGSGVHLVIDGIDNKASLYATTSMPTKRGPLTLTIDNRAANNAVNTDVNWVIKTDKEFKGDLNFTSSFTRTADSKSGKNPISASISINPGKAIFNDTVWNVHRSRIGIADGKIEADMLKVTHDDQMLLIDGVTSADSTDILTVTLQDIDLDYIFSTLNISNVMFGGQATGKFFARTLLTPEPVIYTPLLSVKGLSYNGCVMGDGLIKSAWHPDTRAITLNAEIKQANGLTSFIDGSIKPLDEELDFQFDANKANVGFLLPFMSAFAKDVSGYASGKAHLYGTFKLIDMTGDIYAEDLKLKLGFTNVTYTASDSVHIRPGRIELDKITLKDLAGNTAELSGTLTHECFKKPVFTFNIEKARNLLVYDVGENPETNWYGKIYGNGSASVSGKPGEVNINVDMTTTAKSEFTFVLSDEQEALDLNFITFRNKNGNEETLILSEEQRRIAEIERQIADESRQEDKPSTYHMNIAVNVTPAARVILVMDPVGGDKIKANGSGSLRMTYDSANEELKMFGTYTLDRGSYNFTLQEIILKDFSINPGSSITFHGDPYAAQLDITAVYSVNANLSDLDESFLQDKELTRTNVPVHALLKVTGDMRQPDINFDLEFPTLTQDTYRKVRSIISTDDMMNRQIIYLLALNRFYTPDYMASTTKGNELVSVASSTISSQLSSLLGSLSDKWSIAPNFRSDRGDFSDLEVDVALSSHLLNNRLLLNGNFGYRDKSLNNNSFIGDFDAEYLLNRSGTIRLKAYNRYNDQNFYFKSALTTQGIGVVFKRDFENIFSFLKPLLSRGKKEESTGAPTDSIDEEPTFEPVGPMGGPAPQPTKPQNRNK